MRSLLAFLALLQVPRAHASESSPFCSILPSGTATIPGSSDSKLTSTCTETPASFSYEIDLTVEQHGLDAGGAVGLCFGLFGAVGLALLLLHILKRKGVVERDAADLLKELKEYKKSLAAKDANAVLELEGPTGAR